mmetsp:Transcript_21770/g.70116  ORF Transcript_21770/g.70116 Transcript_21770/m.70116 type:complete len:258 (-) Transcript_21770:68-841(-)
MVVPPGHVGGPGRGSTKFARDLSRRGKRRRPPRRRRRRRRPRRGQVPGGAARHGGSHQGGVFLSRERRVASEPLANSRHSSERTDAQALAAVQPRVQRTLGGTRPGGLRRKGVPDSSGRRPRRRRDRRGRLCHLRLGRRRRPKVAQRRHRALPRPRQVDLAGLLGRPQAGDPRRRPRPGRDEMVKPLCRRRLLAERHPPRSPRGQAHRRRHGRHVVNQGPGLPRPFRLGPLLLQQQAEEERCGRRRKKNTCCCCCCC